MCTQAISRYVALSVAALFLAAAAPAPSSGFRPSAPAVRIDATEAPTIDGDL